MKAFRFSLAFLLIAAFSMVSFSQTPEETGTRLMKENDDRPVFERVKNRVHLKIYSSSGQLRFTKLLIMGAYTENMGTPNQVERYITYFMAPPDDMGNSYLAYNYKNIPDEKYLYLKGIRKAKKVTGADKKLSFFGSDFTNGDMGKPDLLEWKYRYIGDRKVTFKGKEFDCYAVEAVPINEKMKRELGYGKKITFLEKKTRLSLKLEYYDEDMTKWKEMRLISFTSANNVRGEKVYYETGLELKNVKTGSRTELLFLEPKFESESKLRTDIFTIQYLTQKWW
ncbi:MAG: outer membrane lipoprotein-sorting protein [Chrysiogenales bacterium]|nr:MAG: outer membrane lipoprotein-sorting protein [Chrysiogenales bacterium]